MLHQSRLAWMLIPLTLTVAMLAFGCSDDEETPSDGTPSDTTAEATADDATPTPYTGVIISPEDVLEKDGSATETAELKIGWMFEISGPPEVTGFGVPTGDGVKLAVDEINKAGGFQVGDTVYTIDLVEHDTKSTEQDTIAITQALISDDGVKVIFGPATLGETSATTISQGEEVLHLCPCQEREKHALSSVEKAQGESKWAFQTLLPFSLLVEQGAKTFSTEWPDLHTMAFLCQNSATGKDICERTRDAYQEEGVEIIGDIQYFTVGTTDYRAFLTALKNQGEIDYLYNYDNPLNTVQIVRQALELGVGKLHLVTVPAALVQPLIGREIPSGIAVSAGAAPRQGVQPTSEKSAAYFQRYAEFKGMTFDELAASVPANFVSLMTYDYMYMVAAAMQRAGSVDDTTAISEELSVLHYNGVAEDDLFFNSRHLAVHGTEPCVVRDDPTSSDLADQEITCTHNLAPPEAAK